jgi:hypothetical protein
MIKHTGSNKKAAARQAISKSTKHVTYATNLISSHLCLQTKYVFLSGGAYVITDRQAQTEQPQDWEIATEQRDGQQQQRKKLWQLGKGDGRWRVGIRSIEEANPIPIPKRNRKSILKLNVGPSPSRHHLLILSSSMHKRQWMTGHVTTEWKLLLFEFGPQQL